MSCHANPPGSLRDLSFQVGARLWGIAHFRGRGLPPSAWMLNSVAK